MLPVLALIHRWAGLVLAAVMIVLGLTGAVLVFRPELTALAHPEQAARPPAPQADWPALLAGIQARHGDDLRTIRTPRPGFDAWELWLEGEGRAFLDGRSLAQLDRWQGPTRPLAFLFDLHKDLLLGRTGHLVVGAVGIAGTVMLITGAVLWWPRRRSFRPALLRPKANRRGPWLSAHWTAGIVLLPLLLIPMVTGIAMVFGAEVRQLLTVVTAEQPRMPPPAKAAGPAGPVAWAAVLTTARSAFPDADLVFISPPRAAGQPVSMRLRQPGEWHPNGRTVVQVEPTTGGLLQAVDALALSRGERVFNTLYPLHAGRVGGLAFALLMVAGGLGLAWLSAAGIWAWVRGRGRTAAATAMARDNHKRGSLKGGPYGPTAMEEDHARTGNDRHPSRREGQRQHRPDPLH